MDTNKASKRTKDSYKKIHSKTKFLKDLKLALYILDDHMCLIQCNIKLISGGANLLVIDFSQIDLMA